MSRIWTPPKRPADVTPRRLLMPRSVAEKQKPLSDIAAIDALAQGREALLEALRDRTGDREVRMREMVEGMNSAEFRRWRKTHLRRAIRDAMPGQRALRRTFKGIVTRDAALNLTVPQKENR